MNTSSALSNILTKYEKTRILGQRAKQINNGVKPLINVLTINNSKYILGKISSQFNKYLELLIDKNKLCSKTYSLDTPQGIINCIKWYLNNNN